MANQKDNKNNDLMVKIVSLCKRRGFVFPGSEIYGGLANSWDYGPLGVELKNNIKNLWWKKFVQERDDMVGIDAALIMNPKVWEASGHLDFFSDPLMECKKCHYRFRPDEIEGITHQKALGTKKSFIELVSDKARCPNCSSKLVDNFIQPRNFNLMFKTFIGPAEDQTNVAYFRPETAQAMFVDFKNVLDTTRKTLPFGIAQIGKAFRNEITPGNFIFRTREFEQMEIEYFVREAEWEKWFEYWLNEMKDWLKIIGVAESKLNFNDIMEGERAHYSKRTIDIEYEFPFGMEELYGLAYRGDFDLKNHFKSAPYKDAETGEEFWPHVIEPSLGVDRMVLTVLCEAYDDSEKDRVVLKLPPKLAPYKAAVFPLLANKPELVNLARKIYDDLRKDLMVAWDDRGNIGKRYYSQDEIGTPFCITIDFDSLEKDDATVRDRDTIKQDRIKINELANYLKGNLL